MKNKGFTLIELLAVITIMGILLLVAIPAVSRTIENSRKDTYVDVAQKYIDSVRNAVISGNLVCGDKNMDVAAIGAGKYYYKIDSANDTELLESGGKSSYGGQHVTGYVLFEKQVKAEKEDIKYYITMRDSGGHGIKKDSAGKLKADGNLGRASVVLGVTVADVTPATGVTRCKFLGQS